MKVSQPTALGVLPVHIGCLEHRVTVTGEIPVALVSVKAMMTLGLFTAGAVIAQAQADLPTSALARKLAKKQIAYFERNQARMRYQTFRQAGYFIGSGVVEAGCKTVVGQRLKLSGMLWSCQGASHLLVVRCALLSGWFDDFWKHYNHRAQSVALAA